MQPTQSSALHIRDVRIGTDSTLQVADIVVRDGLIEAITAPGRLARQPQDTHIDGRGLIALPGFINAHAHSGEQFEQGAYEHEALEVWLAMAYPPLARETIPVRWHYLRAMQLAIQSLRSGVTAVHDDFLNPGLDEAALDAVLDAYADAGLRARVAVTLTDRTYLEGLPLAQAHLPEDVFAQLAQQRATPLPVQTAFFRNALKRVQTRGESRLSLSLGPRGPQRCTPDLLAQVADLARSCDVPVHMHVLESPAQAVAAQRQYGYSYIQALEAGDLLNPRLSMNHAVWLSQDDIARIARSGARVVHNPLSNLKLASGLCPLPALQAARVPVALGTDGAATGDSVDYFDSLRMTALLHRLAPEGAPSAARVLEMATVHGAASMGLSGFTGELAIGQRADITLLDASDPALLPLNDVARQVCYAATSRSVHTVLVDGQLVYQAGRCTRIDEDALRAEIAEAAERFAHQRRQTLAAQPATLLPALRAMVQSARAQAHGLPTINRIRLI